MESYILGYENDTCIDLESNRSNVVLSYEFILSCHHDGGRKIIPHISFVLLQFLLVIYLSQAVAAPIEYRVCGITKVLQTCFSSFFSLVIQSCVVHFSTWV